MWLPCHLSRVTSLVLAWLLAAAQAEATSHNTTTVLQSGSQSLTVLNLNFWGLGWPWGSDKDVRWV